MKKGENGMSWAQKAMVGCGLGLNREGKWTSEMLFLKYMLRLKSKIMMRITNPDWLRESGSA